jgi:hypothetical protein
VTRLERPVGAQTYYKCDTLVLTSTGRDPLLHRRSVVCPRCCAEGRAHSHYGVCVAAMEDTGGPIHSWTRPLHSSLPIPRPHMPAELETEHDCVRRFGCVGLRGQCECGGGVHERRWSVVSFRDSKSALLGMCRWFCVCWYHCHLRVGGSVSSESRWFCIIRE